MLVFWAAAWGSSLRRVGLLGPSGEGWDFRYFGAHDFGKLVSGVCGGLVRVRESKDFFIAFIAWTNEKVTFFYVCPLLSFSCPKGVFILLEALTI